MAAVTSDQDELIERIRKLQLSREEVEARFAHVKPFDPEAWPRTAPAATEEELAEMEELMREREEDRQRSLAAELEA